MDSFIVTMRRKVTELVRREGTLPAYGFLPDDVAHLPVVVVGRPSIFESGTSAVMTISLDVILLGRRVSDEDSQAELDAHADELFDVFGGTRGVKIAGVDREDSNPRLLRCSDVRAGTSLVAGQEIPAYSFSLALDIITC